MQKWTEASFDAVAGDGRTDAVVWLQTRRRSGTSSAIRPAVFRQAARVVERGGARLGRAAALIGIGCIASGMVPNSALAPVGPAMASIEALPAVPPAPVSLDIPPAPIFAASAEDLAARQDETAFVRQREEVEDFLRFGSRDLPRSLVGTIVRAAKATQVDPIYLMALADKESSFRTDVKAGTSSAEGLFQFIDRTWFMTVREFGAKHGLADEAASITMVDDRPEVADAAMRGRILDMRCDPYLSAVMAGELLKRDAAEIGFRIGRRLTNTEMYLAHFPRSRGRRPLHRAQASQARQERRARLSGRGPRQRRDLLRACPARPSQPVGAGGLRPHRPYDRLAPRALSGGADLRRCRPDAIAPPPRPGACPPGADAPAPGEV